MINLLLGFYNHVVHVDFEDVAKKFLVIDLVHHSLIGRPCISKTKGHYVEVIVPLFSHEGRFLFIFFCHGYLVVARIGVHER